MNYIYILHTPTANRFVSVPIVNMYVQWHWGCGISLRSSFSILFIFFIVICGQKNHLKDLLNQCFFFFFFLHLPFAIWPSSSVSWNLFSFLLFYGWKYCTEMGQLRILNIDILQIIPFTDETVRSIVWGRRMEKWDSEQNVMILNK